MAAHDGGTSGDIAPSILEDLIALGGGHERGLSPIATPAEPDPVLALIEAHRAAYAAWDPLAAVLNEAIMGSPEFAAAEAAAEEPGRREQVAMTALMAGRRPPPRGCGP